MAKRRIIMASVFLVVAQATATGVCAQSSGASIEDLTLEEILQASVTSVAKRPQRVEESAAAVFVISREDIRRSGVTTLPELFRMVPGMEVADLASGNAAVTARGFNGRFSNKLLVLIDGRAIYLSTLSGVLWDQQLPPVEDIERIEVVRGPGATLWGANAVNGVINIVTKHSVDTLGTLAGGMYSSDEDGRIVLRVGRRAGERGAFRAYVVGHEADGFAYAAPERYQDRSSAAQAGFRYDLDATDRDSFTVQADVQTGRSELDIVLPAAMPLAPVMGIESDFSGYNLLGRWTRTDSDRASSLQVYWDHVRRQEGGLEGVRRLADIDFSQHFRFGQSHEIVWGAGYRWSEDEVSGTALQFTPSSRTDNWFGAYVQDGITVIPDRLSVYVGAKLEHNDYTGWEVQPSLRAAWTAPGGWTAWAAVSRAVRTPSRLETSLRVVDPIVSISPAGELDAERLVAWEAGWRGKLGRRLSLDVAGYINRYDNLIIWNATPATGPGQPFLTLQFANGGEVETRGVELALDATVTDRWTVKIAASTMDFEVGTNGFATMGLDTFDGNRSPGHQFSVRSWFDVSDTVDLDVWVRQVAETGGGTVSDYTDLDVRLSWRPTASVEVSIIGQNLLDRERLEMIETGLGSPSALVQRRVWFSVAGRY